jgi:tetratricopeptide (TPR) repeat protein
MGEAGGFHRKIGRSEGFARPHNPPALPIFLCSILSCATPDRGQGYPRALAEGERAESAGRYAEAAERFDEAARDARIPRDRDYARHLAGLMREHAGDRAGARADFEALADGGKGSDEAALAAYEAARMEIEHGDEAAGWRDVEAMVLEFPNDGVARAALHRLLLHEDTARGDAATLELLRRLSPLLEKTERAEEVAYETALRLDRLGRAEEARNAFVAISVRWAYPHGPLFDDSLHRASVLDEQLGRYDEAIQDLERMLAVRESSWFSGSYERPRFDAAQMRIADLYANRLHDHAKAKAALHELYADFKTSLLRDEALWKEAALWERDGDATRACDRLATLVHDFPDSRYVPCAVTRCAGVSRPSGSKAPETCRHYLQRGTNESAGASGHLGDAPKPPGQSPDAARP